ncbi:tyrosine-type recombinase/integrase [Desulfovibrio aerotolerans]|uniref:Tyrosine-type recombinase/integrase n=1 Tax=Solidesulfovibrio aerotolerans TaxID=295255 RepID=A0A7C9IVB1_9BACT|nr:site-specific integrase [Solidesulfovibrio aerotolerans]MYL82462.1 tyrosine-type recombinase/integrase [Solidesulfovibrio aerotolerans]
MDELSIEMIREIIKKHLNHIQRVNENAAIFDSGMMTDGQFEEKCNAIKYGKGYFNRLLQKRENDIVVEEIIDGFLNELSVEIDKESNQYKILKHGVILNYNKLYHNEVEKVDGEISLETFEHAMNEYVLKAKNDSNEKSVIELQEKTNKSKHSLTCIWEKFQKEKIEVEHKREASFNEFRAIFNFFIEFAGDVPVDEINGAVIRDYRQLLLKLPKNRIKHKEYKNKTIKELQEIEIPEEERISLTTVNKYLGVLQSYFNYAVREAFIERNPVVPGMIRQVGGNEMKKDARPFTSDELNKIFSSSVHAENDNNNFAYRYWIPLIALFTGARSNEICQLYLDDIREVEGVWVFDVNNNMPDKQIKNEASRRLIPIHPFLLTELELLKYVNKLRRSRNARLFPELKLSSSNKYNAALVNWFMRLKNGLRLDNGSVNFHSFRKTYANFCKQNKVRLNLDEHMYKRILGHALNDITADVYANEFSPSVLYENIIVKINFDAVDFSHVLRSKFIVR